MKSLNTELREVIGRRLQAANASQVLAIASALAASEVEIAAEPVPTRVRNTRFETREDVVIDHLTGLMWTRANMPGGRMKWAEAKKAAEAVTLGGHTDWRLPTVRELLSIVDYERSSPAIDTTVFECESAWYWSATPYQPSPGDYAWVVNFGGGNSFADGLYSNGFVRAVRAGQSLDNWVF